VVVKRFLRCSGSRESIDTLIRRSVCCSFAPRLRVNPMPPRITQKSCRPRVSHRIMVGTLSQSFACVASEPNGVEHHGFMKLSSGDQQLGLALSLQRATSQSGRTNHPSENERAGCKSPHPHLSEGPGEVFFLHILFHRMSVMACLRQLSRHCLPRDTREMPDNGLGFYAGQRIAPAL
jgi:hypothetical protein